MTADKRDGMNYAPRGKPAPVVEPGAFTFAVAALDHGHVYGQCGGLLEAGATLKWVYDPDAATVEAFRRQFPQARPARSIDEILADADVRLVAAAAIPCERGPLGLRVMDAGKDYFSDKCPFTTMAQLEDARRKTQAHAFKAAELCLRCQEVADARRG
jgi:predicted dehydrogenase